MRWLRGHGVEVRGEVKQRSGPQSLGGGSPRREQDAVVPATTNPSLFSPQSQFLPHAIFPVPCALRQESLPQKPPREPPPSSRTAPPRYPPPRGNRAGHRDTCLSRSIRLLSQEPQQSHLSALLLQAPVLSTHSIHSCGLNKQMMALHTSRPEDSVELCVLLSLLGCAGLGSFLAVYGK